MISIWPDKVSVSTNLFNSIASLAISGSDHS